MGYESNGDGMLGYMKRENLTSHTSYPGVNDTKKSKWILYCNKARKVAVRTNPKEGHTNPDREERSLMKRDISMNKGLADTMDHFGRTLNMLHRRTDRVEIENSSSFTANETDRVYKNSDKHGVMQTVFCKSDSGFRSNDFDKKAKQDATKGRLASFILEESIVLSKLSDYEDVSIETLNNNVASGFNKVICKNDLKTGMKRIHVDSNEQVDCSLHANTERAQKIELIRLFWNEYRKIEETRSNCGKRIDFEALAVLELKQKLPIFTFEIGPVIGVEVHDEFRCRVELKLVGLHSCLFHGIDYSKSHDGQLLATSVVAREGYLDDMMQPNVIIYTGEGGIFERKGKFAKNQVLKAGNLALYNSMLKKSYVRVIRGIKLGSMHQKARGGSKDIIFVYDGLYTVVDYKKENIPQGNTIIKFKLERCLDQKPIAWEMYK